MTPTPVMPPFYYAHQVHTGFQIMMLINRARKTIRRGYAASWQYIYKVQYHLSTWKGRRGGLVFAVVLLLLFALSSYLSPMLQDTLEAHYSTDKGIEGLRGLILNVGSALIGAAAIVSSLVMFAMQVNIDRMPHGLFRRLSADPKLLSAFAWAFLLAIGVVALSILTEKSRLAIIVLAASWGIIFILVLFMYAYRRALILINPLQQLGIINHDARKELQAWTRRAQRAAPLLEPKQTSKAMPSELGSTHDLARTTYFRINAHWTQAAERAVRHSMSFARRYAEQGDYEVAGASLNVVVKINAAYVETKGKTFFTNNPFIENPLASDGFINDSLEHLRQHAQAAVARRDEQEIEQALQAMAALVQVYLAIDYSIPLASKTHANIAAGYLSSAVQSVVPHNMADVLLEGVRLMGRSAQLILAHGKPNDIAVSSEKIALIACTGCAREDYRPVTMEGMAQLANLTFDLFRLKDRDIHYAAGELRRDVTLVVKLFLALPDTPLSSIHSTFLGPYYQGLLARLTALANALSDAKADDTDAQSVIRNIEQWADDLYKTEKELFLAAIKAKSHFMFDMIQWITEATEILLAVSNAPACDEYCQQELRKHARGLIAVLTWIPDDKETITFIENFQMTETLFDAAVDARNRDCEDIAKEITDILLTWTFKGGKYQTGWGILERGLCGLAVFALRQGDAQVALLKSKVSELLAKDSAPVREIRDHVARDIRKRAAILYKQENWTSSIEIAIAQVDHQKLRPLLEDIANSLSPNSHGSMNGGMN